MQVEELKHQIISVYERTPQQTYNIKQVMMRVGVKGSDARKVVQDMLNDLCKEGVIEKVDRGEYQFTRAQMPKFVGRVDMTASGMAFIVVEGGAESGEKDIVVEPQNLHHAMHDDIVEVAVIARRRDGRKEGEVLNIIKETKRVFVGRIEISEESNYAFVVIDSRRVPTDIFVPQRYFNGAVNGQKVLVEVFEWPSNAKNPTGKVLDVLGNVGDNNTEMHAILAEYDLPYSFPKELEEMADKIPVGITEAEIAKRRDMRGITTFTIDPADAKDFDDALSVRRLDNGNWEVGVHIADVTHYVHVGDDIDKEAVDRATSVYLVDRTIPMLPEKLSNFLCSLRPNEEKLTFSAVFEISDDGEVKSEWFGRTIIYSDRRFSYEEAQAVIEGRSEDMKEEILTLDRLAKILRADRFKKGSIGFERDEAKFVLDEHGKPLGVYFKEMKDSNQLIEEFMLLANKSVAHFIGANKRKLTFVYRVHDVPKEEKFENFKGFIMRFGYHFKADKGKAVGKELTQLLQKVKGTAEENLISTLAIRSMAKATYTTHNIGHYGLAFDYYTHFTSPIRRYPDMIVHRLLQEYLNGGKSAKVDEVEALCEHSSAQEIKAAEAERASIKYKMVEFMEDKIGMEFEGVISGVTDWGIYVELDETKIEGMVSLRDMSDDYYSFDGESYAAVGHRTGRRFRLGDCVKIKIKRADLQRKQLDFEMMGTIDFATKVFSPIVTDPDMPKGNPNPRERNGSGRRSKGSSNPGKGNGKDRKKR